MISGGKMIYASQNTNYIEEKGRVLSKKKLEREYISLLLRREGKYFFITRREMDNWK